MSNMSSRVHKLNRQTTATRQLLAWAGVLAVGTVLAATVAVSARAQAVPQQPAMGTAIPPAILVRPGLWSQDDGSYLLPAALDVKPRDWPTDGWYRVVTRVGAIDVQAVPTPAKGLPGFLLEIATQVVDPDGPGYSRPEAQAEAIDTRYIRAPGASFAPGRQPTVTFSNGVLRPKMDHAYALSLVTAGGELAFTLSVQNGLRNKAGVAYGHGAQYTLSYGGETYTYALGQYGNANGLDTVIQTAADIDGDGKPDLLVQTDGGTHEFLLLSSRAKPGRNAPAAVLVQSQAGGC